jgi:hypothetical protein
LTRRLIEEEVMEEQKLILDKSLGVLDKSLGRRQFTLATAMAMLAGVAITITEGCGSSYSSPTSGQGNSGGGGGYSGGDKTGAISNNHGHSAVITAAQITAGGDLQLNIQGTASHAHTISLTGAQIVSIGGGTKVAIDSTTDSGHSHTVTFN